MFSLANFQGIFLSSFCVKLFSGWKLCIIKTFKMGAGSDSVMGELSLKMLASLGKWGQCLDVVLQSGITKTKDDL